MRQALWDWLCFLVGRRRAIERLAATPGSWRLGLVLVLCAGIAREYDQVYLLHAPVMFLVPLIASFALANVYFLLLRLCKLQAPLYTYPAFIGLFWLTAPLAWLYALPFERHYDPVTAVWANTVTLGIVATWRVLLFARVLAVLNGQSMLPYLAWTLFGGSIAIWVSSFFLRFSLVPIMGGLQVLTPAERTIEAITDFAFTGAIVTFCLSIPLLAFAIWRRRPTQEWPIAEKTAPFCWVAASLLFALWCIPLAKGQADFQRLQHCRNLVREAHYKPALAYVNELERMDFPPGKNPFAFEMDRTTNLIAVADETLKPWIREALIARAEWLWNRYPDLCLEEEEIKRLKTLPRAHRWLEANASEIAQRRATLELRTMPTAVPESQPPADPSSSEVEP